MRGDLRGGGFKGGGGRGEEGGGGGQREEGLKGWVLRGRGRRGEWEVKEEGEEEEGSWNEV